jgi:XTP/dITP diphosphohydrolase
VAVLLVATGNPGKLVEFEVVLTGQGLELRCWPTEVEEAGETYEANAALKSEAAVAGGGLPALGDDSGLEVEALGGFPGLHSARLAPTPEERIRTLLSRLTGVGRPWRARFGCVVALSVAGQPTRAFRGERWGEIVEPRGAGGGFGYDPVFWVPEVGQTFAEMEPDRKHQWSHRGAAVRALVQSGALSDLQRTTPTDPGADPLK